MNRKMEVRSVVVWCLGLLFVLFSNLVFSKEIPRVFVPLGEAEQPLVVQMAYLEDADGSYTIDQVSSGQAGVFQTLKNQNYSFTYKKKAFWIRFSADLSAYNGLNWFLMQNYEHVGSLTVFYPGTDARFLSTTLIEDAPPGKRLFNIHNYLFKIPAPPTHPTTYYVRFAPDGHALNIDLSWAGTKGIVEYIGDTHIGLGLFFGGLLVMWIYNFFLFFYLRDRTYFYYLYYLGGFIGTFFYIYGLAPLFVQINAYYESFFAACAYAAVHGMILFSRHFLSLKKTIRWLDSYLVFFQWVLLAGLFLCFIFPIRYLFYAINYLILLVIPFLIIGGGIRSYQGYKPAYLYSVGWMVFGAGLVLQALKTLELLSSNFLTTYAIQFASVWESIIFALALATRLRLIEKEKADMSHQLVKQLQATVALEKNAAKQKTMFISAVNHELRSPLQSLTGAIEVLSVMAKSSPMEKTVDKITRASQRITAQMRDIGEFSRLEAGILSIRESTFTLRHLLEGILDDFSSMAKDKKIVLNLKNLGPDTELTSDYDRIRQILTNLVSNAIRCTQSGGVEINGDIETTLSSDGTGKHSLLIISVGDTGVGIPEKYLPHIFDMFVQIDSQEKTHGTGLGLAIVKRIIDLLNASITVESQVGKGTQFVVRIPVRCIDC